MGAAASVFTKLDFSGGSEEKVEVKKDTRRRNSLAFNISQFVTWPEDDFNPLCEQIRKDLAAGGLLKKEKVTKFSRMADAVLRGDMRELKGQVVNFQTMNRKYGDHHNNQTLLHMICLEGYPEMFEFVLNPRNHAEVDHIQLDIDAKNNKERTPLFLCFTPPTATYLGIRHGVDATGSPVNEQPVGHGWLRPGGQAEREECIRHLISQKCSVNLKDYHDFTALHYAAMWGWEGACKMLLEASADVNAVTMTGRTSLMYACEFLHEEAIMALCKKKDIMLNMLDTDGQTALLIAMEHGEEAVYIIETLLQSGADVNQMNHKKRTPLHIACENQQAQQVRMLLNYKCHRRNSAFELLQGDAAKDIQQLLMEEEAAAAAAFKKMEQERERLAREGMVDTAEAGYKNKNPYGQWVDYIDKRNGSTFYYNKVSRESRRDKPKDFKADRNRPPPETTFGHAFYH